MLETFFSFEYFLLNTQLVLLGCGFYLFIFHWGEVWGLALVGLECSMDVLLACP